MNRKIFWKFNIIDLVIIAIVLLSLFALGYRMIAGDGDEIRAFTLTFVCESAPMDLLEDISVGAKCADGDLGSALGSVKQVKTEVSAENSEYGKAFVAVEAEGAKAEHGVSIGDTVYLKGKTMNLIIADSVFEVYIKDIE